MLLTTTRDDHLIAWLAALAITIHIAESVLPSPLPGVKPGLANVITIVVLIKYGWRMAAWVGLLRVLVGSLLLGTLFSPTFWLSFSGALGSIATLGAAYSLMQWLPERGLSALGYSLLAAMAHMASQFWVAYLLFIPHPALFHLLPVLMTAAVIFGIVSGMITHVLLQRLP
jgi:heptaprenyl diphosphate synthase